MIFKCVAKYSIISISDRDSSGGYKTFDYGTITHLLFGCNSYKEANTQFNIIVDDFKKIFKHHLDNIRIVEISEDN